MKLTVSLLTLVAAVCSAQPLNITPFNKTGIYRVGEKAGWTVSLAPGAAAKYTYEIRKNNLAVIQGGPLDFKAGSATIEISLPEPAMLSVTVRPEGGPPDSAVRLGAAIAPTELQPTAAKPVDFDAYWNAKIQNLSLVPLNPFLMPVAVKDGVELSIVQVDCWGTRVRGYIAKPIKLGQLPALVIYEHEGIFPIDPSAALGYAAQGWLTFDVDAHDIPPNQAIGVPPNYAEIGMFNRETSYFLNMYLRDVRAMDYLRSRPDWDGQTIVLMGKGMGGQRALVVAALRPQASAVIVDQPTGADTNGELHGRKTGYPNWPPDPRILSTALYFDTVNFAPRIKAPVLAAVGFLDSIAPPAGIYTMLNQIRAPKEIVPLLDDNHAAFNARVKDLLSSLLRGGQFR